MVALIVGSLIFGWKTSEPNTLKTGSFVVAKVPQLRSPFELSLRVLAIKRST